MPREGNINRTNRDVRDSSIGLMIADILAGSWRRSPPRLDLSVANLTRIGPQLLKSGAGALAWWRIRHSGCKLLRDVSRQFRSTYLGCAARAAECETEIVDAFNALRSSGIEPILLKGWAIAQAYPESGLRPCGDIDLCVSPDQRMKAEAVLGARDLSSYYVDLDHDTVTRFGECCFERLYARSQLVNLRGSTIRVPSPEDHLRILCLHLLKHGAWRPLWLCDVAAALESRSQTFDWDLCLGINKKRSEWILCAVLLAHQLLGADIGNIEACRRSRTLPNWLVKSVLKQWDISCAESLPRFAEQVAGRLWTMETLKAMHRRWPNPIQATVDADGSFRAITRLPYQIRDCARRAVKLCRQYPQLLRPV